VVNDLFPLYMTDPRLLPERWQSDVAAAEGDTALARIVADYIAGMTDRFALQQHERLVGGTRPAVAVPR
jgi:dGTPase